MKITVKVEQKHINNGTKGNCYSCPIARAISDIDGMEWVQVDHFDIKGTFNGVGFCMTTPQICKRFMFDFDQGYPVTPFEFELEVGNGQ